MQSLIVATNNTDDEARDDSMEHHKVQNSLESPNSLPRITNTPIRIKNRIYTVVDKFAGKPQFTNNQLLKADEVFIGGTEDEAQGRGQLRKNKRSMLV